MQIQKILGLVLIGILVTTSIFGQTWTRMQSWGLDLEAISWIDERIGVAVGENLIIRTTDGGDTWEEVAVGVSSKLLALAFYDKDFGLAVGEKGLIFNSRDAGRTWTQMPSFTLENFKSVTFSSQNNIFIITDRGKILRSTNQGENWNAVNSGTSQSLNQITFTSTDSGYVVGEQGLILRTYDGGNNWTKLNSNLSAHLNGIAFSTALVGYAVGDGGTIIKTLDGGNSWVSLPSTVTTDLQQVAISPLDIRIITVVGDLATALRSTNSGMKFGKANLGNTATRNLKALAFKPSSNLVWAVGQDGYLISSVNAGSGYTQRLAGIRNDFSAADFKSDRAGHITGQKGADYFTGNGAASLLYRPIPEGLDIVGMDYWNTSFGYVGAASGTIYRTGNSGSSWVSVPAPTTETITGFYLFAPSVVYITGTNGYIARSFNSGDTWDASSIETNTTENLRDITYFDYQIGFAIGSNGQISWTNGGNVWENLRKSTSEDLIALSKLDSTTALIVGNNGIILKSVDKAKTWKKIDIPFTENLNSVDFWDNKLGFISGENGLILQTKDGGETWLEIASGTSRNVNGISASSPTVAFAVGDDGTILKYECVPPGSLSEITGESQLCLSVGTYSIGESENSGSQVIWRADGGEIISGQGSTQVEILWKSPGRNGVFVSMENFCGNGKTSSMEVTVSAEPSINLVIEGNGSVCLDQTYTYTLPSNFGVSYTWEGDGAVVMDGQGTSQIQVKWINVGIQELRVTQENSCGKANPLVMSITVNRKPDQPGEIQGESQAGLWEATYEIPTQTGVNFKWEVPEEAGTILQGQGTEKITVLWKKEGEFQVVVIPENQCNDGLARSLIVYVNVITGLPEKEDLTVRVFPNPSNGIVNLHIGDGNYRSLQVINVFGQVIYSVDLTDGRKKITFEHLPRGVNLFQLYTDTSVIIRRILIK